MNWLGENEHRKFITTNLQQCYCHWWICQ